MNELQFLEMMNRIRGLNTQQALQQSVQQNSALMGNANAQEIVNPSVPVNLGVDTNLSKSSDSINKLGQGLTAAGAVNPILGGVGLGLQFIGGLRSSKAAKERQREQERQNYLQNVIGRLR